MNGTQQMVLLQRPERKQPNGNDPHDAGDNSLGPKKREVMPSAETGAGESDPITRGSSMDAGMLPAGGPFETEHLPERVWKLHPLVYP